MVKRDAKNRADADAARRVDVVTFQNGLSVAIVPGQHLSRAAITFVNRVGARFERPEDAGLSHFLEHMLHRGTPRFPSAHALASGIEEIGASLDASTGVESGALTMTCPPDQLLDAADILGEITFSPLFTEIDVERGIVREELLEDRDERGRLVDPDGVARAATFGEQALGQPIVGTLSTLRRFDTAALSVHHAKHYTTSAGVLAVSGRLPPRAKLLSRLERAFMRLPRGRRVVTPRYDASHAPPRLTIVRTHASQVSLRISSIGPGRRARQVRAAELLLRVIDDGNATRLYDRLCDRLGLCYDVSAGFEAYSDVGFFDIAADAAEVSIPRVLAELCDMLFELTHAGPRPDEVQKAAQRARWQADRARDQPEALAEQAATGLLFGDVTSPGERAALLSEVPPAAIKRVAAQLFDPSRLAVSLVGPVSRATERAALATLQRFARRRP